MGQGEGEDGKIHFFSSSLSYLCEECLPFFFYKAARSDERCGWVDRDDVDSVD